jgi:hypothetical protein
MVTAPGGWTRWIWEPQAPDNTGQVLELITVIRTLPLYLRCRFSRDDVLRQVRFYGVYGDEWLLVCEIGNQRRLSTPNGRWWFDVLSGAAYHPILDMFPERGRLCAADFHKPFEPGDPRNEQAGWTQTSLVIPGESRFGGGPRGGWSQVHYCQQSRDWDPDWVERAVRWDDH